MTFIDYYNILGINKTATPTDIKNAYRKLARKYHPDLNPNDKDAKKNFQQINEANEVLSDPMTNTERIGNMLKNLKKQSSIRGNHQIHMGQDFQRHHSEGVFPIFSNPCLVEQRLQAEADR
jgi:curved DNA-binding protein